MTKIFFIFFISLQRGYDAKFLLKAVESRHGKARLVASSSEKFQCFEIGDVHFLDSSLFLKGSLADLTNDVQKKDEDWRYTPEALHGDERLRKFMKQKLPFPYSYFDHVDKFKVTKLPHIDEFHDHLHDKPCDSKSYKILEELWPILGSFEALHDFYLALDVLQLCDIGETFRDECLREFKLDPSRYRSLPCKLIF